MKTYLKNLSISKKIFLIILMNAVFLIIIGYISYFGLSKTDSLKNQIVSNGSAAMYQMNADMMHDAIRADVYNALLLDANDEKAKQVVLADLNEHIAIFNASLGSLESAHISDDIKLQVRKVTEPLHAYVVYSKEIVNNTINRKVDYKSPEGKQKLETYKSVFNNLAVQMEQLSELIEKNSLDSKDMSSSFSSNVKFLLFVLICSVLLVAILIGIYLSKMISKPVVLTEDILSKLSAGEVIDKVKVDSSDETGKMLNSLNIFIDNLSNVKQFVTEVGNGNFSTDVVVFNNKGDIYESLSKMKSDLKHTEEEDTKRNWATQGMARFGDILRNNTEGIDVLSTSIISNLVKYLGANQGGLFIVNDTNSNDRFLELAACYAWEKRKHVHIRVNEGEGLVGQAWQEADVIYITDVPQDYVTITSGLGSANPTSVLIVPLTVNDVTYGVIEIASFNLIETYQIEFLKKLAESIASTLSSAKINERTKLLLEQSQMQAEQMRAQEEEMRQNMEEMQATQEEMERASLVIAKSVAESAGVLKGINSTMATIEFTPNGIVVDANDNFIHTMKCTVEEIKGKHHRNFVPKEILESEDYKTFWTRLASGVAISGIFKRINAKGETVWLNAIYNPILDDKGVVIKVVKFATDITQEQEMLAENKGVFNGINATMATIEFTPEGVVLSANDNFIHTMKCTVEEIKGKHHRNFVPKEVLESEDYRTLWSRLASGLSISGKFERINAKGETVWLNAIYNPILNASGEVVKVVKFATDITLEKKKELEVQQLLENSRAQEEEIRQTLEEVQSTSEESERKAMNYEMAIQRLNEENDQLRIEIGRLKK